MDINCHGMKKVNVRKLNKELKNLTSFCKNCEINEPSIMEIHHINENRNNNKKSNLIGLCPTCHKLVHKGIIEVFNQDGITFINKIDPPTPLCCLWKNE